MQFVLFPAHKPLCLPVGFVVVVQSAAHHYLLPLEPSILVLSETPRLWAVGSSLPASASPGEEVLACTGGCGPVLAEVTQQDYFPLPRNLDQAISEPRFLNAC